MKYAPKSAPQNAPQTAPRSTRITATATQGEHGLWYISGTPYTFTRDTNGTFRIYAPGCAEDGLEYATSVPA